MPTQNLLCLALLALAVACAKNAPSPKHEPTVQTQPGPLDAMKGDYRLVEVDGETMDSGTLSVLEDGTVAGIRYHATLGATSYDRELTSPQPQTSFKEEGGKLSQKHETTDHKVSLVYDRQGGTLTVEAEECRPGICLVTLLTATR